MPVFKRRIDAKIQKAMRGPKTERVLTRKADEVVRRAKDMLDDDIDLDMVSQKIEGDPKTIGYFGFDSGDLPVEELKRVVDARIDLNRRPKKKVKNKKAEYTYNIKFPSSRDIYSESVLNLPWISKTWVEGVEKGLSDVERFAFKPGAGRSEFGVQLRGKVKDPISPLKDDGYIGRIRNYFSENLKRTGL